MYWRLHLPSSIERNKALPNRKLHPGIERLFDIVAANLALVVLAIPFAAIALAIRLESKGPVFYRQQRAGRNGKPFNMFKFRTMVEGA